MKIIITESQYSRAVDYYISHLLEPHEVIKSTDSIYWVKDEEVIAEIEKSEDFFLHPTIFINIYEMFDFSYYETKSVIKMWLEKHYDLGELEPDILDTAMLLYWETIINKRD